MLGAVVRNIFDWILPFFRIESTAHSLAGFILFFSFAVLIVGSVATIFKFLELRSLIRKIRGLDGAPADRVDRAMGAARKTIHGRWQSFKDTLIQTRDQWRHTVAPESYFNLDSGGWTRCILKAMSTAAGVVVGLGLLFTFLGLVAALGSASATIKTTVEQEQKIVSRQAQLRAPIGGIASAPAGETAGTGAETGSASGKVTEPQEAKDGFRAIQGALVQLLTAASIKFSTSIAGLLGSIILTIFHFIFRQALRAEYAQLSMTLTEVFPAIVPEHLLEEQRQEIATQTEQIKRFNTDLGVTIGAKLNGAIVESMPKVLTDALNPLGEKFQLAMMNDMPRVMTEAMTPMAQSIDSMSRNITQQSGDMIKSIAGEAGESITRGAREQTDAYITKLAEVNASLSSLAAALSDNGAKAARDIEVAAGKMLSAADAIKDNLAAVGAEMQASSSGAAREMALESRATLVAMQQTTDSLRQAIASMAEELRTSSTSASTGATSAVVAAVDGLKAAVAEMKNTVAGASVDLRTASSQTADEAARSIAQAVTVLNETILTMRSSAETASDNARKASEASIDKMLAAMTATLAEMQAKAAASSDSVRKVSEETVSSLLQHLVAGVEKMNAGASLSASKVEQVTMGMADAGSHLGKSLENAAGNAADILGKAVVSAGETLDRGIKDILDNHTTLASRLGTGIDGLKDRLLAVQSGIGEHVLAIRETSHATKTVTDPLVAMSEAAKDAAQMIELATESLAAKTQEHTTRSAEIAATIRDAAGRLEGIWKNHAGRFEEVDVRLGHILKEVLDGLDKSQRGLVDYVKGMDSGTKDVVTSLHGLIDEVGDRIAELGDVLAKAGGLRGGTTITGRRF